MEKEDTKATTTKIFDGGVTEQQIEAWKAKHRKVSRVEIVDDDETHVGYFKRPDFATVKAGTAMAKKDELEAGKILFDNCWLGGSPALREDAILFVAVYAQLSTMLTGCMGTLKNL